MSNETDARRMPYEWYQLIDDLTDADDCWFDHHGYCQAHMWFETEPKCPHARAKELLRRTAAVDEVPSE